MSVQPEVVEMRSARLALAPSGGAAAGLDELDRASLRDLAASVPGEGPVFVARAPRRLEVMGGSAAFMGSLVLTLPLGEQVTVAARLRRDGQLSVLFDGPANSNGRVSIRGRESASSSAERIRGNLESRDEVAALRDGKVAEAISCAFSEAERAGPSVLPAGGLTIAVAHEGSDSSSDGDLLGSIVAAGLAAASAVSGKSLPPRVCNSVAKRLAEGAACASVSAEDIACPLYAEAGALNLHRHDADAQRETVNLPEPLVLLGVDSGAWSADRLTKCFRYRTAAYMGRFLVDRMIRHDGADEWNGMLAHLSVDEYVHRYRDRIPTKMKGSDFLERFGEFDTAAAPIEPAETYKLRSRTEHSIYEHARAGAFADALRRHARGRDPAILLEAGELMYASHWSYGQRCGLGSIETDLLVNLIRRHGERSGIVGAKITGIGGGGVVCVLMQASDGANVALDAAVGEYAQRTGLSPRIMRGSSTGAMVGGVCRIPS